jgi:soluble lytic murein transglycosylase-like protein
MKHPLRAIAVHPPHQDELDLFAKTGGVSTFMGKLTEAAELDELNVMPPPAALHHAWPAPIQTVWSTAQARLRSAGRSCMAFVRAVIRGVISICHNTLALVGLGVVAATVFVGTQAELRHWIESHTLGWLQQRFEDRLTPAERLAVELSEPNAVLRATAVDPNTLTRKQAAVALWISRRYRVAPEPIGRLVQEAWSVGQRTDLDPTLILAIMAIESSFNPFAQSKVGAQGLMQVMTQLHDEKYQTFGGTHAAFDPVSNLRVGVQVLKGCISRAGSLEAGLRYYVGAANLTDDGGYAQKVLAEQRHLRDVANGRTVPITVSGS